MMADSASACMDMIWEIFWCRAPVVSEFSLMEVCSYSSFVCCCVGIHDE